MRLPIPWRRRRRSSLTTVIDAYASRDVLGATFTFAEPPIRAHPFFGPSSIDAPWWFSADLGHEPQEFPSEPWVGSVDGAPCRFVYEDQTNTIRNVDPIRLRGKAESVEVAWWPPAASPDD